MVDQVFLSFDILDVLQCVDKILALRRCSHTPDLLLSGIDIQASLIKSKCVIHKIGITRTGDCPSTRCSIPFCHGWINFIVWYSVGVKWVIIVMRFSWHSCVFICVHSCVFICVTSCSRVVFPHSCIFNFRVIGIYHHSCIFISVVFVGIPIVAVSVGHSCDTGFGSVDPGIRFNIVVGNKGNIGLRSRGEIFIIAGVTGFCFRVGVVMPVAKR
mmetsp:Transcript_3770/g.10732  ORF Transcript_3770/g.10732 Transcript_3770/m.10732 type:complete len:214 (-) Transcript_3770:501-1142(-)